MRTWDTLCAGGLSGVTVDVILFPLDTIKTRLQARSSSVVASRSFYKGLLSAMSASFPCAALFWVLYDGTKAALLPHTQGVRGGWVTPCVHVGAAAVADVFVTLLRNPFEVVKQQMQIGSHRSTLAAVRTIAAVDGLRGFYAGYVPTLAREIPFDAVQFALYEAMKSRVVTHRGRDLQLWENMGLGAISGACAAAVTTPLDVAKTRLMTQTLVASELRYTGVLHALTKVYEEGGVRALFAGIKPRVAWISVGGAIFIGSFEEYRRRISNVQ